MVNPKWWVTERRGIRIIKLLLTLNCPSQKVVTSLVLTIIADDSPEWWVTERRWRGITELLLTLNFSSQKVVTSLMASPMWWVTERRGRMVGECGKLTKTSASVCGIPLALPCLVGTNWWHFYHHDWLTKLLVKWFIVLLFLLHSALKVFLLLLCFHSKLLFLWHFWNFEDMFHLQCLATGDKRQGRVYWCRDGVGPSDQVD